MRPLGVRTLQMQGFELGPKNWRYAVFTGTYADFARILFGFDWAS